MLSQLFSCWAKQLISVTIFGGEFPCLPGSTGNPHPHVVWPHLPFSLCYLSSHSVIETYSPHLSLVGHLPGYIFIFCPGPCCLPHFFGSHLHAAPFVQFHYSTDITVCRYSSVPVTVVKSYGRTTEAPE